MVERIAEWRIAPRAERALVEERRRRRGRRRAFQAVFGLFGVALLLGLGILNDRAAPLAFALTAPLLPVSIVLAIVRSARAKQRGERYRRALKEEHGGVGGWIVEMTVRQGAATTGVDHGVVWAESGRLYFVGARTSFGLFASDVELGTAARLATEDEDRRLELPLRHRTCVGQACVVLRPLAPGGADAAGLGWTVRSWSAQDAAGEGQLPPLALGPDAPRPPYLFVRAVGVSLLWASVVPLALIALVGGAITILGFLPVLLTFRALARLGTREFGNPLEAWCAWSHRRRLEGG